MLPLSWSLKGTLVVFETLYGFNCLQSGVLFFIEYLPFLQDEDREVVLRRMQELTANNFENIVPISAKNGDGLQKLTDKIRDVVEELRLGNGSEELPIANDSM